MKLEYTVADYEALKPVLFDSTGKLCTTGLFEETKYPSVKMKSPFKLSDWHKVYMAHSDVTEYGPAMELLGNWGHWMALRKNQTLGKIFDEWKLEVEIKIRSENVAVLMSHAKSPGGTAAAKWLAEAGFNPRDLRLRKSREMEEKIKEGMISRIENDYKRLMEP